VADDADDIDALAAEYVLGTLDVDERRAALARIGAEPAFRRAVAMWQERLQPLADSAPPRTPSPELFGRIVARVADEPRAPADNDNVVALRQAVSRWQIGFGIATAAAVVLLAMVVADRIVPAPTQFVATLTPDGGKAGFVLTVDTVKSTLSIRRIAAAAPDGKSYELWAVPPGQSPKSLGVVQQADYTRTLPYDPNNLTFAISLEPPGGSPTGVATGPIVFSGSLVKSD
jgi:anti-sigma-K factor RskA